MFGSWLNGLIGKSASSTSQRENKHCFRPRLEQLEDRSVPATLFTAPNLPVQQLASTILQNTTAKPNNATLMVRVPIGTNTPLRAVGSSFQAGTFGNAGSIIGLNRGVVIGGVNVGILPQPYIIPDPSVIGFPGSDVVLSFQFVPNGRIGRLRIVMASDEYGWQATSGGASPFPDQVGVFVNGAQRASLNNLPISPANFPLPNPNVIPNLANILGGPPLGLPGAGTPWEINTGGFTRPIQLQFPLRPNVRNTITFAETEMNFAGTINNMFPTWLFIEPLQVFKGPRVVAYNPYNWVYQPASHAYLGIITITNTGDLALTAGPGQSLYVTLPGLPSGSTILNPPGTGFLPGTSIRAVRLPIRSINPGQTYQFQLLVTNPYNLALPSIFTAKPVVVIASP